jgi:tRNA (guanine-N7-)-methyltransferase
MQANTSTTRTPEHPASVRIMPDDWLHPLPLDTYFADDKPMEIDLGCGKGRFLLAHAAAHPEVNFLGIDRMLRRIRKVDRKAVRANLSNVRLLRMEAYYATVYLVPPRSVRAYYIFFPDPWPKARHQHHRLFSAPFLDALARSLQPGGLVHTATDHMPYFEEVDALLRNDPRFEVVEPFVPGEEERTDFELLFLGRKQIGRCSVRRRA